MSLSQSRRYEASWWKALSLAERLHCPWKDADSPHVDPLRLPQAQARLARWRGLTVFQRDIAFDERLRFDALSEEQLLTLLAEDDEHLHTRCSQTAEADWPQQLAQAYQQYGEDTTIQDLLSPLRDETSADTLPLYRCITPLLTQAFLQFNDRLQQKKAYYPALSLDNEAVATSWLLLLVNRISSLLVQTLVLEVNVARLEGRLQGETPTERFHSFLYALDHGGMLDLLQEYPVLARLLVTGIECWLDFGCEIVEHLGKDWTELGALYGGPGCDLGQLVALKGDMGDVHQHGRSVTLLTFTSSASLLHILYKPKSLTVDKHFQCLLAWLNSCDFSPSFALLRILDKGGYGWCEYVEARDCQSPAEIERFYQRQGAYLAILTLFEATDFHFENVIAAGEQPVLIDLEAMLHPYRETWDERDHPATRTFQRSVLRVGLLPQQVYSGEEHAGVDFSGLGGNPEQMTSYPVSVWQESGTDTMHIERQPVYINRSANRPCLHGVGVSLLDYRAQVKDGFSRMYQLLMKQKSALIDTYLPLFLHDPVRVVLRPTSLYVILRKGSLHPNSLRDGLDRDRFLDRLFIATSPFAQREKIVRAERMALLRNDIPLFTTLPTSRDLVSCDGQCIHDFFVESSASSVRRHIEELSDEDMGRQLWLIEASFACQIASQQRYIERKDLPRIRSYPPADHDRLLKAAMEIGDRLCQHAIYDHDTAGWLTLTHRYGPAWKIRGTDFSLYDGTPGIILFLAYLGHASQQERYTHLARIALNALDNERYGQYSERIGAFDGLASLLYLFTQLAQLWHEPALYTRAEGLLTHFEPLIERDRYFDIISGVAGALCVLLGYFQVSRSPYALQLAQHCGRQLVEHAQAVGASLAWPSPTHSRPLTGFSHGCAGIAYSLYWLAGISGDEHFRSVAGRALNYERSLFSAKMQNWPDLRSRPQNDHEGASASTDGPEEWMVAWCHGASGIGLSRLGILPYADSPQTRAEILTACSTVIQHGATWNHGLCHGTMGNLETLHMAASTLQDERLSSAVAQIAAQMLTEAEMADWITGVPLSVETPGLMTGIAGIGYQLLRLAEPATVPSILLLHPPQSLEI